MARTRVPRLGSAERAPASRSGATPPGRLDRDQRRPRARVAPYESLELLQALPQHRQGQWRDDQASCVCAQPDPVLHLAWIDGDDQTVDRQRLLKKISHNSLQPPEPRSEDPGPRAGWLSAAVGHLQRHTPGGALPRTRAPLCPTSPFLAICLSGLRRPRRGLRRPCGPGVTDRGGDMRAHRLLVV
jgi:hypothetical protein